ncbi:outer membrane protein, cobalt-zinc-cadmium efflux system [Filimonas lacunae]|uniref:Outer membrane protein, cobalt-zinc-cadmium efflux system n=1 Tax=Filimonas lacunae TaxID=477680 RepID=A0A173MJ81_9BACT|nr:TolC family protein [Filimonas lacunae]BAV07674.1 heavy metal RND efflux outer membrane protein, CzcC family [Filimonas lacunae]SIT03362.1 outer membrane protein, cobalt-zinc-cadmium efflux system [Filimonas lacunae]
MNNRFNPVAWTLLAIFYGSLVSAPVRAQQQSKPDTLRLSMADAEKRFIDSNLQLLAAHYNVDAQKALVQQAKLWDNPVLSTDQVVAANGKLLPYNKRLEDGSTMGQYSIQLQQLIYTARKRGKQIDMAVTNGKVSELQLQDLLRNLRYQLHNDYYTIAQQFAYKAIYKSQLEQLNKLSEGMKAQLALGNIAQKDYLRIQALVITLTQDMTDLEKQLADTQSDIRTLLQVKDGSFVKPAESETIFQRIAATLPENVEALIATAQQHNPYYQLQETQTLFQQQNLAYQKALRVPDITVQSNFDKNSSVAPNYWGVGISVPLPLFNRNQGNIKSAESNIKQQQALTMDAATDLQNNVRTAYHKLSLVLQQNSATQQEFYTTYQQMQQNMVKSYSSKQVSLPEFIDFFTDFTAVQQRLVQQQMNLALAKEELNYAVGTDVVP